MNKMKVVKPLSAKKLDVVIEQIYRDKCSGAQIPMLEISSIYRQARKAYMDGFGRGLDPVALEAQVSSAIVNRVNQIRVN